MQEGLQPLDFAIEFSHRSTNYHNLLEGEASLSVLRVVLEDSASSTVLCEQRMLL